MIKQIPLIFLSILSGITIHAAILNESLPGSAHTFHQTFLSPFKPMIPLEAQPMHTLPVPSEPSKVHTDPLINVRANPLNHTNPPYMKNYSGTILKAVYQRASLDSVQKVLDRYKTFPGGVTMEGNARGIPEIKQASFSTDSGTLMLNNNISFTSVLTQHELKKIFLAIDHDDLLGVSLGSQDMVYGSIRDGSIPVIQMKMADHYLGSIVFANEIWVHVSSLPANYRPLQNKELPGVYAVYFNWHSFNFKDQNGQLSLDGAEMNITLIPLKPDGNDFTPDFEAINTGRIPASYERNIGHIIQNISTYEHEPRLNRMTAYGEAAAIARSLKMGGQLTHVINQM